MTLRKLLLGASAAACLAMSPSLASAQAAISYQDDTVAPILNVPVTQAKPLPTYCVVFSGSVCGGGSGGGVTANASATPTVITAGSGKSLNLGLFSDLFVTITNGAGGIWDPTAAGPVTQSGSWFWSPSFPASAKSPITGTFVATGQSATFQPIYGRPFNITLSGTFVGTVQLERQFGGAGTWFPITAAGTGLYLWTAPASESAEEDETGTLYRLNATAYTSGTVTYRISQ